MMANPRIVASLLLFCAGPAFVLGAAPARATPLEDRLREQLQATTTQLRELQATQAGNEAAKVAAEKERDALKAKLAAGGGAPAQSKELAAARNENVALAGRLGTSASELAAANARSAELSGQLTKARAEAAQQRGAAEAATATMAARTAALQDCTDRNTRLVATGRELVALHQKRYGYGDFPPLQVGRTRIENEAQAMGDKVNADTIIPNADSAPPK